MKKIKNVALVLSSGGSKGLAHIGVINELERQGFNITSISGSSIGSVCGGLHAMGKLPEYTKWVKTLDKKSIWGLLDFTFSKNGLLKGDRVFNTMKTIIPDVNIEEMKIPFTAVATDIINEKSIAFNSGSFYDAIRASVAIPSIIKPVNYKDTILVDGGVLDPIPIEYVKRNKDDLLVVVNLYGKKCKTNNYIKKNKVTSKKNSYFDSLTTLISTGNKNSLGYISILNATTFAMVHKLAKFNIEKHKPDIVISIPTDVAKTFDFHLAEKLIKLGKDITKKEIEKYLKKNE